MRKNKKIAKRIVSFVCALLTLCTVLAVSTFAADSSDIGVGAGAVACEAYAEQAKYKITFVPNYSVGGTLTAYDDLPEVIIESSYVLYVSNSTGGDDILSDGWYCYYLRSYGVVYDALTTGEGGVIVGFALYDGYPDVEVDPDYERIYRNVFCTAEANSDNSAFSVKSVKSTATLTFFSDERTEIEELLSYFAGTVTVEEQGSSAENIGGGSGTSGGVASEGGSPSGLVNQIFSGFGTALGGMAGGMKSAFSSLIYADGVSGSFSPLVIFLFSMLGLGLAAGIVYKIVSLVRNRR